MTQNALIPFLSNNVPAFAAADAGLGNENIDSSLLTTPRLKLLQSLSPEVKKTNAAYIDGAEPGDMVNSVTGERYKEVYVVNLKFREEVVIFRKKIGGAGGGFLGKFNNMVEADNFLADNGLQKDGVELTYQHVHTCLLLNIGKESIDVAGMIEVPLKSTGLSVSRKWNTEIQLKNPQVARFASIWHLTSNLVTKGDQEWYKFDVDFAAWAPEAIYTEAKKLFENLQ